MQGLGIWKIRERGIHVYDIFWRVVKNPILLFKHAHVFETVSLKVCTYSEALHFNPLRETQTQRGFLVEADFWHSIKGNSLYFLMVFIFHTISNLS